MRKLWKTARYKDYQARHMRKLARRRNVNKQKPFIAHGKTTTSTPAMLPWSKPSSPDSRQAPPSFKLFQNPDAVIAYCDWIRSASAACPHVTLDFEDVRDLTADALLFVRALVSERLAENIRFSANLPRNQLMAAEFVASGFLDGIRVTRNLPKSQGLIRSATDNIVHGKAAGDLVHFAEKHANVERRRAMASYDALVELMSNTHDHAVGSNRVSDRPSWYASTYCKNGVAYFSFLDLGVGIPNSAPLESYKIALKSLGGSYDNKTLLADAFCGEIGSATKMPWRGKGLPKLKTYAESEQLVGLRVLTLDLVGVVANLSFSTIKERFPGTAFRWSTNRREGESGHQHRQGVHTVSGAPLFEPGRGVW